MRVSTSVLYALVLSMALLWPGRATAHCDTLQGPVVAAARASLKSGDVTPVLKWVKPEHEQEIRAAFARALRVRALGEEARELADMAFFETVVRVHRAGEGEPYTGLKAADAVEPGIAAADRALDTGSADELARELTSEISAGLRRRLAAVQQARQGAEKNVAAGREYVAAYVEFIHYVERLYEGAANPAAHPQAQVAASAETARQHQH